MKNEYKVAFVILHYQLIEMTKVCVKCIEERFSDYNIDIIIVDNASPNGSGATLEELYLSDSLVKVIKCSENYGFSKGNNIGYKEARRRHADFIIVMNNDVEIQQTNFLSIMFEEFNDNQCFVMGPDIINLEGIHQSPQRDHYITAKELKRWYYKRLLFLYLLQITRRIPLFANAIRNKYSVHDKNRIGRFDFKNEQFDVELQGAFFIFTPLFVSKREYPFEEISFMYGEEPMMGILCKNNGWHTYYNPRLKILHKEKSTTRSENIDYIEHEIFYTRNMVAGLRNIIKRYI